MVIEGLEEETNALLRRQRRRLDSVCEVMGICTSPIFDTTES